MADKIVTIPEPVENIAGLSISLDGASQTAFVSYTVKGQSYTAAVPFASLTAAQKTALRTGALAIIALAKTAWGF